MDNQKIESGAFRLFRWFIAGAAVGAASAYFLDPKQGRKRRHLARDQSIRRLNDAGVSAQKAYRDFKNRAQGFVAKLTHAMQEDETDNETLLNRVRSKFGHHVSHPRAIFVRVHDGEVILTGHVLTGELEQLLACVRDVPGVRNILNRLETHENADGIPGLQQGESQPSEYLQ